MSKARERISTADVRSYIASLIEHVKSIHSSSSTTTLSPRRAGYSPFLERDQTLGVPRTRQVEHVFAHAGGAYRYLGGSSCLIAAIDIQGIGTQVVVPSLDLEPTFDGTSINLDVYIHLGNLYLVEIEPLFPLLNKQLQSLVLTNPTNCSSSVERLILFIIYNISCRLLRGSDEHKWLTLGEYFRKHAMGLLEACTTDPTMPTLRIILLLAISSLFEPRDGNIGQQIALASRLAIDLASNDLDQDDKEYLQQMHSVIFCLENEVATCLDRPATFAEPVCQI